MRTLEKIMDDLLINEKPSHDECYYALMVYKRMFESEHYLFRKELANEERSSEERREKLLDLTYFMYEDAMQLSPKEWLSSSKKNKRKPGVNRFGL